MPRVTCLKCGSQYDVDYDTSTIPVNCECGPTVTYPEVHYSGVQPSERAAERLRYRAFHSAGLVRNFGIIALTVSAVSVLFFPLAIVGVGIGVYTLVAKRGPLGKYVGREQAIAAIVLGILVFGVESAVALDWLEQRRISQVNAIQASVRDDLRRLFRTQRLFRAAQDRYGRFDDFPGRFRPGAYTLYLGLDDVLPAERDGGQVIDQYTGMPVASVTAEAFTAVAVANLDGDADLDIWTLTDSGDITHHRNDNDYLEDFSPPTPLSTPKAAKEPVIAQQEKVDVAADDGRAESISPKPAPPNVAPPNAAPPKPGPPPSPVPAEAGPEKSAPPAAIPVAIDEPTAPPEPVRGDVPVAPVAPVVEPEKKDETPPPSAQDTESEKPRSPPPVDAPVDSDAPEDVP